jgi:hypothetical protein
MLISSAIFRVGIKKRHQHLAGGAKKICPWQIYIKA